MANNTHGQSFLGPLIFSLVFHLTVFIFLTVGMPFMHPKVPVVQPPISVEFIEAKKEDKQKKKEAPKKKNTKPQSAPKNTAEAPKKVNKPKEKPPEKVKPVEKPAPKKPLTKPKIVQKPKEKPKPKKKDPPKQEVQQEQKMASLLKNLQESENLQKQEEDTKDEPDENANINALADQLTANELSVVSAQIGGCWFMPTGAKDAQDLIVDVRIFMNPDRTVKAAQIVDRNRYSRDAFFRAAAESALRAVRNPGCSPLKLPPEKYDQWKSFVFRFDPKDML